jgi:CubicO group peptidase (beta-lactamase class C family)
MSSASKTRRFSLLTGATALTCATALLASAAAFAQPRLPPPQATDPVARGVMAGFPPAADRRVTLANVLAYPNSRWAFHHMRELGPTLAVSRGALAATPLAARTVELDALSFDTGADARSTIAQWQADTYTDGLLVLHRGRVVYERYGAGMQPQQAHALWSVSKSFVGLLTAWLVHDGVLDARAPLSRYVPELAGTAWADATVQDTLDMTTGVAYSEVFSDPQSGIHRYLRASGLVPAAADEAGPRTLYDFLASVKKEGEHGAAFRYKSTDSEVLGWVLRRVTGKSLAELLSERVWSPLGAQEDAYYWLDGIGTDVASVGLNATLRDLGRFGELMRQGGRLNGRQIVPAAVVAEIRKGGDRQKFAAGGASVRSGYSYHDQWWIAHDADQTFEAKGVFGQHVHVNPAAELVIVKLSSHPVPDTAFTHTLDRAAFAAIAEQARRR